MEGMVSQLLTDLYNENNELKKVNKAITKSHSNDLDEIRLLKNKLEELKKKKNNLWIVTQDISPHKVKLFESKRQAKRYFKKQEATWDKSWYHFFMAQINVE